MKTKQLVALSSVLLFLMATTATLMVPASAQKPDVMVHTIGHFTTNWDYQGSGTDHRCFINLHARHVEDEWTGRGVFRDRDYADGQLVATLIVDSVGYLIESGEMKMIYYKGTANVYINGEFDGNYVWLSVTLIIKEVSEQFIFQSYDLGYYAYLLVEYPDITVETTIR